MKYSKFLIIGGLVVAGLAAYEIYKHCYSKKDNCRGNIPNRENNVIPEQNNNTYAESSAIPASDICESKEAVIDFVKARHCEAAKAAEESLNTIFKENEGHVETENSEVLEKAGKDLDDLLK